MPFLSAVLLSMAFAADASTPPPLPTATEALKLFKAGRFDVSCPMYEAIAGAKATDGAAWADLGLCEFRRGRHAESARRATLLALRYGDAAVRAHAAFNLSTFDVAAVSSKDWPLITKRSMTEPGFGCERSAYSVIQDEGNYGIGREPATWSRTLRLTIAMTEAVAAEGDPGKRALQVVIQDLFCGDPKVCDDLTDHRCNVVAIDPCSRRAWIRCGDASSEKKHRDIVNLGPVQELTIPEP